MRDLPIVLPLAKEIKYYGKNINILINWKRYTMIDVERIKSGIKTVIIGTNIYWHKELESTNDKAMELAKSGAPEGTIVGANFQTAGKGRAGKEWFSPASDNLLFSVILRPTRDIEISQKIVLAVADIIIHSISKLFINEKESLSLELKWPNDILYDGKKIAGILTQSILIGKKIDALVVGIGININTPQNKFPKELREKATSLSVVLGKPLNINDVLINLINDFEKKYIKLERTGYSSVVGDWKKNCYSIGKEVLIERPHKKQEKATFEDIADDGFLIYSIGNKKKKLVSGSLEYI
jgi:BirA family biotin operon repressor/biotin-[acetyl-CoA-carboxylase] ligase